jgi:predicted AlkP superfamily phosphohydrolase/phosphomutase
MRTKIQSVVEKVSNNMIDPDLEIECFIPEHEDACDNTIKEDSYVLVKYSEDEYTHRKIKLTNHLDKDIDDVVNYVTFSIEQFKEEVDSLRGGAQ